MNNYKSRGERMIAKFLEDKKIKFIYEPYFLIEDKFGKKRIWYPDFYLPDLSIIIEFFGMENDSNYDIGVKKRKEAYKRSKIDLIEINPKIMRDNWKDYITLSITSVLIKRYNIK